MKRPSFESILAARLSRRTLLAGAIASGGLAACAQIPTQRAAAAPARFKGIAPQTGDDFVIADGYRYNLVARWGDSLVTGTPDFDTRRMISMDWLTADAVDAQNRQFGTNADAVQYFPLVHGRAAQGLVCVNHEYFSAELVFAGADPHLRAADSVAAVGLRRGLGGDVGERTAGLRFGQAHRAEVAPFEDRLHVQAFLLVRCMRIA